MSSHGTGHGPNAGHDPEYPGGHDAHPPHEDHAAHALRLFATKSRSTGGEELREPPTLRARDGVLAVDFVVRYEEHTIGSARIRLRSFVVLELGWTGPWGPTLRLGPGDQLVVTIRNDLPPNPPRHGHHDHNVPHDLNTTNLHTHGLHVSPYEDDVFRVIEPTFSGRYHYRLRDHIGGTHWYHPHVHGSTGIQVASGMSGMLVVEGDFDHIPEIRAARDLVLLFNAIVFQPGADGQPGTLEDFDFLFGSPEPPEGTTINGQVQPVIRMRPGEVQRWRMVNSEFLEAFGLKLEGHRLHQIAADGIPLAAVRSVEAIGLSPGNRIDVLVQASATPGDYRLVAPPYDPGYEYDFADGVVPPAGDGVHLATVRVEGDAVAMDLPRNLDGAARPRPIPDADLVPPSPRQLQFTIGPPDQNIPGTEPIYVRRKFGFNGERFFHTRIDHTPRLGTAEEWHLATIGAHPFHIHVNPFLVTEVGGRALRTPVWKDTILVPAGAGVRAKIRTRYDDFAGDFVLHCHILTHEDVGMMQRVRITE